MKAKAAQQDTTASEAIRALLKEMGKGIMSINLGVTFFRFPETEEEKQERYRQDQTLLVRG